jgi:DNA polymerase (family X)
VAPGFDAGQQGRRSLLAMGATLAISTDAHSVDAFQCIRFDVDQARRAGPPADDVLNTRSLGALRKLLKR